MRPSLNQTMMDIAKVLAKRGTCLRKQVGCVMVDAKGHILAGSYNGQAPGESHCNDDRGCAASIDPANSCEATHAEINGLIRSDPEKVYAVYITEEPCMKCLRAIRNTSCVYVFFEKEGSLMEIQL